MSKFNPQQAVLMANQQAQQKLLEQRERMAMINQVVISTTGLIYSQLAAEPLSCANSAEEVREVLEDAVEKAHVAALIMAERFGLVERKGPSDGEDNPT